MSRIFKISGNFSQYGEWASPDPSFTGEIVMDEDTHMFCGYCDELYDGEVIEANLVRYLVGAIAPNGRNGKNGIAFYKLSNYSGQLPLMYAVPELQDHGRGEWAVLGFTGGFASVGEARVEIKEIISATSENESYIKARFGELDTDTISWNSQLLKQVHGCVDVLTNAQ